MKNYKKNKRKQITIIVIVAMLLLGIGYAVLTTTLKVFTNITLKKVEFAIHFDNVGTADNNAEIISAAAIIDEPVKREIMFNAQLNRIDDWYAFTTDIVNEGSIPGKIKSIEINGITESQKKLLNFDVRYTETNKIVAIGDYIGPESSKNITFKVTYVLSDDISNDDLPQEDLSLEGVFVINFENGSLEEYRARAAANRLMQDVDYFPTSFLDFTRAYSTNEHEGVYRLDGTENDDFPIYFYRGSNDKVFNHVKFGGYCWRIIRTTSTGGIKLIYNGTPNASGQCTTLTGEGANIGSHEFNDTNSNNYSTSTLKSWLSKWYFEHLINYQAYLEDTPFCHDSSYTNGNISLTCASADVVSMANGKNNYPIGLITAQEMNLCGMSTSGARAAWLFSGTNYWTISKSSRYNNEIWAMAPEGFIEERSPYMGSLTSGRRVRPVISLNSEVVLTSGNGTTTNPYTVGFEAGD